MRRIWVLPLSLGLLIGTACQREAAAPGESSLHPASASGSVSAQAEGWSVTAWSEHYELFAETEALVAGKEAPSHAHFTFLRDFSALDEGSVTGVLRGSDGKEETFLAPRPARPGIFKIVFQPEREGTYELLFRIENRKASEELRAGRVRVGSASAPGGPVDPPAPSAAPPASGGQPVSFLKEQQWRTEFATDWVRAGSLREGLRAPARVLPAAGGEVTLTAPAEGVVTAAPWPHRGREVGRGALLFTVTPHTSAARTLAELEADVTALEAELGTARARLGRLRELLAVEAVSRREVEEAETRVTALSARLGAARRGRSGDLAVRGGSSTGAESFRLVSPIAGRIATVAVSPGQFVPAGAALGRVVQTSPVWLELALVPAQAGLLSRELAGLSLRRWAGEEPFLIAASDLRWVSRAPEIDGRTGTLPVLLEVRRGVDLLSLGSRVEAELLLAGPRAGIVVPLSALVDDGGVEVVYVQIEGESFDRREVRVEARQGGLALVRGLAAGERLVTRGGNAIRRSSLLGSGAVEGHVH